MSQKTIIGGNGVVGSNTYRVFAKLFDTDKYEYFDAGKFSTLLDGLVSGEYAKIILPTRNAIIGVIEPAVEAREAAIAKGAKLKEEQAYSIPIYHALISGPAGSLESLKRIYSYKVAFEQCRHALNMLGLEERQHPDTYGAVVDVVARNRADEAAIGPIEAAKDLGGKILKDDMSDHTNNTTVFKVYSLA